ERGLISVVRALRRGRCPSCRELHPGQDLLGLDRGGFALARVGVVRGVHVLPSRGLLLLEIRPLTWRHLSSLMGFYNARHLCVAVGGGLGTGTVLQSLGCIPPPKFSPVLSRAAPL